MSTIKTIGVLTSGGDCAGLNAVVRAVVHRAVETYGWRVIGIEQGTAGLLQTPHRVRELDPSIFDGALMRQGGTFLGTTNKGDPFAFPHEDGTKTDRSPEIAAAIRALGIDAVIGIGGDGSQAILKRLSEVGGFPLICIPKTIDNDIGLTEVSIGYDTAVSVATDALDKLQPTAASHDRIMVLEVMGRDAGHIALASGIAGGADVILIPEIPYKLDRVAEKIAALRSEGRNFALVVVAEAVKKEDGSPVLASQSAGKVRYGGVGYYIGNELAERTGAEVRVTVLGHLQRGGSPTPRDRLMATVFGTHAVDLIAEGSFGRTVIWKNRNVSDVPIEEAIAAYHCVDVHGPLVRAARACGICFGDS